MHATPIFGPLFICVSSIDQNFVINNYACQETKIPTETRLEAEESHSQKGNLEARRAEVQKEARASLTTRPCIDRLG